MYKGCTIIDVSLNRISGAIPRSFNTFKAGVIFMLQGNLFSCASNADLPPGDPDQDEYSCGSDQLDYSLIVWLILSFITCIGVLKVFFIFNESAKFRRTMVDKIEITEDPKNNSFSDNDKISLSTSAAKSAQWVMVKNFQKWYELGYSLSYTASLIDHKLASARNPELDVNKWEENILTVLRNSSRFIRALILIRGISRLMAIFVIIILLPVYLIINLSSYSTYQHLYGWITSAGFATGLIPALCFLFLWIIACVTFLCLMAFGMQMIFPESETKTNRRTTNATEKLHKRRWFSLYLLKKKDLASYSKTIVALSFNVSFVLWLNIVYIYLLVSNVASTSKIFIQLGVTFLKVTWNAIGVPFCFSKMQDFEFGTRVIVHVLTLFFNNVAAVLFSAIFTEESCFSHINDNYSERDTITYEIYECVDYTLITNRCEDKVYSTYTYYYSSPILYSYTCSTSIIRSFLPIFFYTYAGISLFIPLMWFMLSSIPKHKIFRGIKMFIPSILWPNESLQKGEVLIAPTTIVNFLLGHVMIMLTFGIISPLLSLAIAFYISIITSVWIIIIGRYIDIKLNTIGTDMELLRNEFKFFDSCFDKSWTSLKYCRRCTLIGAAIFFPIMIFDVAGDKNGVAVALSFSLALLAIFIILFYYDVIETYIIRHGLIPTSWKFHHVFIIKLKHILYGDHIEHSTVGGGFNDSDLDDLPVPSDIEISTIKSVLSPMALVAFDSRSVESTN